MRYSNFVLNIMEAKWIGKEEEDDRHSYWEPQEENISII